MEGWRERFFVAGCSGFIAALTYWNTLVCGFVWDDLRAIEWNRDVTIGMTDGGLWDLEFVGNDFWGDRIDEPGSHQSFRPLVVLSFRFDAWLAGELRPRQFHLTNVVLHSICTVLVGILAFKVLKSDVFPSLVAGVVFAVHTVHTEAVAGLVGRADILACIFFLLGALLCELDLQISPVLLSFASMLCKEAGITLIGYLAARKIFFFLENHKKNQDALTFISIHGAIALSALKWRVSLHGGQSMYNWTLMENPICLEQDPWKKICSYAHAHARYAQMMVLPLGLAFDHGYAGIEVLSSPSMMSIFAYVVLLGFVFGAFAVGDFLMLRLLALTLLPFIPASNLVFEVGTVLAERLLYIPSAAFCILLGLVVQRVLKFTQSGKHHRFTFVVLIFLYISLLSRWTILRNEEWRDPLTLYEAGIREEPLSVTALNNAGFYRMHLGPVESKLIAVEYFSKATELHPEYHIAWQNLGIVQRKLGNHNAAISALEKALQVKETSDMFALLGDELLAFIESMGTTLDSQAKEQYLVRAEKAFMLAVSETKIPFASHGLIRVDIHRRGLHIDQVNELNNLREMNRDPDVKWSDLVDEDVILGQMALIHYLDGSQEKAIDLWEEALRVSIGRKRPRLEIVANAGSLGWLALFESNPRSEKRFISAEGSILTPLQRAEELLRAANQMDPRNGIIMVNLGWLFELSGRKPHAKLFYDMAAKTGCCESLSLQERIQRVSIQ